MLLFENFVIQIANFASYFNTFSKGALAEEEITIINLDATEVFRL